MTIFNLKVRQCDVIYIRASHGMFIIHNKCTCFLITYSAEIFYFHIYHEDFYGLSKDVSHVLGTKLSLWQFAT